MNGPSQVTLSEAESMGYKFILARALADKVLGEDYAILEQYKGKELENRDTINYINDEVRVPKVVE